MSKNKEIEPFYRLNFFQGEVDAYDLRNAVKIFPDVDYWESVFGTQLVTELQEPYIQLDPKLVDFYSSYWAEKNLHNKVLELCESWSADKSHADNLCLPVSDFKRTNYNRYGHDIHEIAQNTLELRKVFELLSKQHFEIKDVTFTIGKVKGQRTRELDDLKTSSERKYDKGFDPIYVEPYFESTEEIKVSKNRAILPFTMALRKIVKENDQLKRHLHNPDLEQLANRRPAQFYRLRKDKMAHVVYRYLRNHGIAKNSNDASGKMGLLISLVDTKYCISEDEFHDRQADDLGRFSSRQAYFSELFRKKMMAIDKTWVETQQE